MAANQTKKHVMAMLEAELAPEHLATVRWDDTRRHPRVWFKVADEEVRLTVPASPSDYRWVLNLRAELRRGYRAAKLKAGLP